MHFTNSLTFYACKAASFSVSPAPLFTFSCPGDLVINIQSALLGFSDVYIAPSPSNPNGSCPWTNKTSASSCAAIGMTQCGTWDTPSCRYSCNCTRSTTTPADQCNGQKICDIQQEGLMIFPEGSNFCMLQRDANFIVVNYTCISCEFHSLI